ncbi:MAG TPA: S8 family peptidase [Longimicrobiaceae bacterium]|nr:S8 family peptidase [Longimicrobiaceae bacterium]
MRQMRSVLLAGSVLALAACGSEPGSPVAPSAAPEAPVLSVGAGGQAIPGQYIVVLKEGADPRSVAAVAGVSPRYVYDAALNGFAAALNAGQLNALRHNPNVEYIEQDQVAQVAVTQSSATWGIDRIDQRSLPLSGTYNYTTTASTVRAYIIDTGLDTGHSEFEGRASNVYDAFGGNGNDCNGHGTHVGGTVSGKLYGVAKKSMPRGVRVLDCNGSGSFSAIIAGVDWVTKNHIKPAVANMSLGGGASSSLDTSVKNLSNAGVFVAVASGNSNADACNYSPARAGYGTAIATVNASTSTDAKASFSNWGTCTDLYAPGASIKSAWIGSGTTETNTISGTSMASPHVAGVGALYKGTYGDVASSTVHNWIINNATTSKITSNPSGTPNRLLFKSTL